MKNIVSTIQREQNLIIRNVSDKNLIVQGAAGSGKTSVEKVLNMAIEDCRLKLQTQAAVSLPT